MPPFSLFLIIFSHPREPLASLIPLNARLHSQFSTCHISHYLNNFCSPKSISSVYLVSEIILPWRSDESINSAFNSCIKLHLSW